jgi:hypothetical protein
LFFFSKKKFYFFQKKIYFESLSSRQNVSIFKKK